ncbi:nucleotidyltransferase domain-containing protein [Streptomyces olivaceus]|uniref:nucleotidyltransferase domain-containing protein n=1 Tax=Streptomyces olivaceus TaxID=47716 RepID=UPI0036BD7406
MPAAGAHARGIETLDPAIQLLLMLARRTPDPAAADEATELIRSGVDWDFFMSQARRHKVAGLVFANLQRLGLLELDQYLYSNADMFRALYLYHRTRNQALQDEAVAVLARLQGEVPDVALRKGLYLAQHVYRDLGLRPMADMDLLMVRADTKRAVGILEDLGYQMGDTTSDSRRVIPLPREKMAFWRLHVNNLPPVFRLTSEPTVLEFIVDISVGLFLPGSEFSVPTEEVLTRAVPVALGSIDALAPAPEDLVMDLCAHLYKEATTLRYLHRLKHQRLIQYCDLREVLLAHGDAAFWRKFSDRVAAYSIRPVAYFALAHLEKLYPGTIPGHILEELGYGVRLGFLDEFGALDLPKPGKWGADFFDRTFARDTAVDLPKSGSIV